MSNQSQVTAHVRDCRNRCAAFECNAQLATERDSGPTVAPTTRLPLWHTQAPNDGSSPKNQRVLGPWEQPRDKAQFVCFVRPPAP
jgi:hypothetical protein